MNYATIKYNDIANGEGVRTSLFVSGCRHHCKGCFNQVAWDFNYGKLYTPQVMSEIIKSLYPEHIAGITFLGGEPMDVMNQFGIWDTIRLIRSIKELDSKTIWIYTGYIYPVDFEKLDSRAHTKVTNNILDSIDVLVDGPFIESLKDISLKFRGSSNQRILNLKELRGNKMSDDKNNGGVTVSSGNVSGNTVHSDPDDNNK